MAAQPQVRAVVDVPASRHTWPPWAESVLSPNSASIIVEVFNGLESVVEREISLLLRQRAAHVSTKTAPGCAHVVIEGGGGSHPSSFPNAASVATALHLLCRLPAVRSAYLCVHHEQLPQALLDGLHAEVSISGAKEAKNNLRKQPLKKSDPNAKPFLFSDEPIQTPWTTSEENLLRAIKRVWDHAQASNALSASLAAWTQIFEAAAAAQCPDQGDREDTQAPRSFRLTFERGQYLLPRLRGVDVQKEAANLAWLWLNTSREMAKQWTVDLSNPDLDITLKMIPSLWVEQLQTQRGRQYNAPGSLAILFRLPAPPPALIPLHRRNLSVLNDVPHSTALLRYRAAALALTATLPACAFGIEGSQAAEVSILEPCCGTGGIAVELAAALTSRRYSSTPCTRQTPVKIYACDLDARLAQRAGEVFRRSGFAVGNVPPAFDTSVKKGSPISAVPPIILISNQVDSSKPSDLAAFVKGPETVDLIMTDLPWGFRVSAQRKLIALYASLLDSFSHVLKKGAYCYLIAASPNVFVQALRQHQKSQEERSTDRYLQMVSSEADPDGHCQPVPQDRETTGMREILIGYTVFLCVLRNTNRIQQ